MIVYEYENNSVVTRELSQEDKQVVIDSVTQKWETWSRPIADLKVRRDTVADRARPKVCGAKKADEWKSKIELNRPYEFYSKLYGILYETFYDKISSYLKMGKTQYDAVYNRALTAENKKSLLACMKDLLQSGEIVASAELQNTYEKITLPITQIGMVDPASIVSVRRDSFVVKQKTGEKVNFVRINPCNFAYDPLIMPCTEDFDRCDKIVKQWKTKQQILSNKSYEIKREDLDIDFSTGTVVNEQSADKNDQDVTVRYNQIEVLTYMGNFTINGRFYEDYVAVVIGRKYLVYFEPRGIYTPGIYYFPYHALEEGARGTSPLYYILDLCAAEQKTYNDSIDFIELQKNPPQYVPEGFFEEEVTQLSPGAHITYNPGMYDPNAIKDIIFNAQPLMLFQESTKQLEKEIAGIDNGQLSEKSEALTEEEVKRVATSDNLIPNMIISGILLNVIAKYLKDCVLMLNQATMDENIVKTAWEYANEQYQMQNIVNALDKIGTAEPSMINLQNSATKVFETMGVNPNEYLNDGRTQQIIQNFAGLSDEVLQQLVQVGQQMQVEQNNLTKASKMMGQIMDDEYRRVLRESWKEQGALPSEVVVPNGDSTMTVPVTRVTPETQVQNKTSTTAD